MANSAICSRSLDGVAYFNTAYNSPLLRSREALEKATFSQVAPLGTDVCKLLLVPTRSDRYGDLFGGSANDYAIIPAASYGISTAAR